MLSSRVRRHEERRQRNRLIIAIGGMLAILAFLFFFGLKILVGFSILVERMRRDSPQPQQSQDVLLPPVLDPLPQATNSATITVTGRAAGGLHVLVFIDEQHSDTLPTSPEGSFSVTKRLAEGDHTISAKVRGAKGTISDLSNVLRVTIRRSKPDLTIIEPPDGTRIVGENATITVKGKTAPDNTVTVNGRFAIVASDGSFHSPQTLTEGDNTLHVVATDPAGNEANEDRRVTYQR